MKVPDLFLCCNDGMPRVLELSLKSRAQNATMPFMFHLDLLSVKVGQSDSSVVILFMLQILCPFFGEQHPNVL